MNDIRNQNGFASKRGLNSRGMNYQGGRVGGRGNSKLICQICFKPGHVATICFHKFNRDYLPQQQVYQAYQRGGCQQAFNRNQLQNQLNKTTYIGHVEGATNESWYLDNGVIHHITNDVNNLSTKEEFRGNDKLIIDNGVGYIFHILVMKCWSLEVLLNL